MRSDEFLKVRLKLSLLYVSIVFIIVLGVSSIFYENARRQLERFPQRFVSRITPEMPITVPATEDQKQIISDIERQIISSLVTVNVSILIIVFFLSYWWAGYTLRPIKGSLEQQKRFIADASHELRTPLAIMRTSVDVFERQVPQTIDTKELVATIRDELQHLTSMSSQMLQLTTADLANVPKELINIRSVMAIIKKRFELIAQDKHVALIVDDVSEGLIWGNLKSLEHALSNLVDNALKYTKSPGTVTVTIEKKPAVMVIQVADTGVGIDPKDLPHIFNRFYQGDRSKHGSGVGLGLSIVKSIVEKHGGTITVASVLGEGSTFRVLVPLISS